jgi:hypothetical protein
MENVLAAIGEIRAGEPQKFRKNSRYTETRSDDKVEKRSGDRSSAAFSDDNTRAKML